MGRLEEINKPELNEDILDQFISKIFDKKNWENKEIWKVAEVTYSYKFESEKGPFFNTTLLTSIGGLNYDDYRNAGSEKKIELLKKAGDEIKSVINKKINQIDDFLYKQSELQYSTKSKKDINELQEEINNKEIFNHKKELLSKSLIYNKNLLKSCIIGLPFELKKAGLKHNFSEEEIDSKCNELDNLDEILFGGKISKIGNTEELIRNYEYIKSIFEENKKKLTQKEIKKYENFLKEIEKKLPEGYDFNRFEKPKKVTLKSIEAIPNKREDYIKGFNSYFATHNMDYKAESCEEVGSVTDTINSLKFPVNEKSDFYDLERIIKLMAHESDAHTINLINGIKLIGNFRGSNNMEKEEGIAILLEKLFFYGKNLYNFNKDGSFNSIDKDKIEVTPTHAFILFAELLNGKDLLKFLKLHEKVDSDIVTNTQRFLRLKRNRPLDKRGCQHKDTTYMRGLFKAIDYINTGNNPKNLFLGKVGFEDIEKLLKIKQLKIENNENIDLIKPMMMYESIYFKLLKKFGEKKYKKIHFIEYLQQKYPFFVFKKERIIKLTDDTKKEVDSILNIFKSNIKKETK